LILGGLWYHHKLIAEGIAEQQAADNKISAKLSAKTVIQTAELKAKATMAEQAYDKEQTIMRITGLVILSSLYGCASTHTLAVASCPKAADKSPEMQFQHQRL